MSVYEDMANDAGYRYGTEENRQMAELLAYDEWFQHFKLQEQEQQLMHYREILFRKFNDVLKRRENKS